MILKNILKTSIFFFLKRFSSEMPEGKAAVLMYHSIGINEVPFTVSPSNFQKQMDYLKKAKYNVIPLAELVDLLKKKKDIPRKTVVLTFDDGFEDNYSNVFPLLKRYSFPATIFLATGFVGKKIPNSAGIPLKALRWEQILEMHNSHLVDFEPHTVSHPKLSDVPSEVAEREILESRRIIEKKLNKKCLFFAYPKGKYNKETQNILTRNGFLAAMVAGEERFVQKGDDCLMLPRLAINSSINFIQFQGKLSKGLELFLAGKRIFYEKK